jgi:hypothetical protein
MSEFLVELYIPKTSRDAGAVASERLRRSAAELTAEGRPVGLVRSIYVPEDETCFLLVEAASAEVVRETARRAAVSYERVVETALDLRND